MTLKLLDQQYSGLRHGHGPAHARMAADGPDFAAICDRIAEQLYSAKITQGQIPRDLYEATAGELMNAVFSGLGDRKTFTYEDPNNLLVAHLRQNIYAFSAARSLKEMQVFNDLLVGDDGKIKPFTQFRNDLSKAGKVFNVVHLKTDYDTAVNSAQIAQSFNEFSDEDYLEVRTTGAENVCPICGGFNGFTRLKTDPILEKICPPFHPNCNCKFIPGLERNVAKHPNGNALLKTQKVTPAFQSNPAINKVVFTDDYPMMNTIKGLKELRWDKAYQMQSIERIYQDQWPQSQSELTETEANGWWKEQAGTLRADFFTKDVFGTVVKFPKGQRQHIFYDNNENRFKYINNVLDVLSDPDEVWSVKNRKGQLITTYIRYYADYPMSVTVQDNDVLTTYKYEKKGKLNADSLDQDRAGVLIFRK